MLGLDVLGSPYVGLYCISTENLAIVPLGLTRKKVEGFRETLSVDVCATDIGGCRLVGALVAANSYGVAVPHFIEEEELRRIKEVTDLNVQVMREKRTALGNLVLVNDKGAVVDPRLPNSTIKMLSDVFNVEVVKGEIYGLPCIGVFAIATNNGVLSHPSIREDEKRKLQEVLKVPVGTGTVSGGVPYVRTGLIANSRGAVVGSNTTGPELMAITRALDVS